MLKKRYILRTILIVIGIFALRSILPKKLRSFVLVGLKLL